MSEPLIEAALAPPALPEPPLQPKSTRRILVVDGDPGVRAATADALRGLGPVETVSCLHDGLRRLREREPFAVILADIDLRDGSGIELLEAARAEFPQTTRLAHSRRVESRAVLEALNRGGAMAFVEKPASLLELRAHVQRGIASYEELTGGRQLAERLWFARESLEDFATSLEARSQERILTLRRLEGLLLELAAAVDLEDVVRRAANSASRLLGGRGVVLELVTEHTGEGLAAHAGPPLGGPPPEAHSGRCH